MNASAVDPFEVSRRFAAGLTQSDQGEERVELVAEPFPVATGCTRAPAPADAGAPARSVQSDAAFMATPPVAVSVGGAEGLAMDITVAPGASVCEAIGNHQVLTHNDGYTEPRFPGLDLDEESRKRLYLFDAPEGLSIRILAIAIVAPEARFESVVEAAMPILA